MSVGGQKIVVSGRDTRYPAGATNGLDVTVVGGTVDAVPPGVATADVTDENEALTGADQVITLNAPSYVVDVQNMSSTDWLYVNFNGGAATNLSFPISPYGCKTYTNYEHPISSFHVLGTAGQRVGYHAN